MRRKLTAAGAAIALASACASSDVLPIGPTATVSPSPAPEQVVPGAGGAGIGDPYFPRYGNGGYDVAHYDIRVGWFQGRQRLVGATTVTAVATQALSRFNLDLHIAATSVQVDGEPAGFTQSGRELVVTPAAPVAAGERMTVRVRYAGRPGRLDAGGLGGWHRTADGAVVAGEPEAASVWYPSNDHPRDKATFDIRVSTPSDMDAVSNGQRLSVAPAGSATRHTTHWRVTSPMATYLAYVALGDFAFERGTTAHGVPYLYAISEHLGRIRRPAVRSLRATAGAVDVFEAAFGTYPFDIAGGTLVNSDFGFALENQTRPVYSKLFFNRRNTNVIAHEIAHQWFGNSVSVNRWRDIWLNEGFATWASWLYAARLEDLPLNRQFARSYHLSDAALWRVPIGDPGPGRLFSWAVYDRGAMAVQALRNRIGVAEHRRLLRTWLREHQDGDATVREFRLMAEEVSGVELDRFFHIWLFRPHAPKRTRANGFPGFMLG